MFHFYCYSKLQMRFSRNRVFKVGCQMFSKTTQLRLMKFYTGVEIQFIRAWAKDFFSFNLQFFFPSFNTSLLSQLTHKFSFFFILDDAVRNYADNAPFFERSPEMTSQWRSLNFFFGNFRTYSSNMYL